MKAACPCCGRILQAYTPAAGDGSAVKVRRHETFGGRCRGSSRLIELSDIIEDEDRR